MIKKRRNSGLRPTNVVLEATADAREVVPDEVDANVVDRLDGIRNIPDRLGHLRTLDRPVRVR